MGVTANLDSSMQPGGMYIVVLMGAHGQQAARQSLWSLQKEEMGTLQGRASGNILDCGRALYSCEENIACSSTGSVPDILGGLSAQHSRRQVQTKVGDPAKEALGGSHSRGADHLSPTQANQHLRAIQEEAHSGHRQPLGRGLVGACPEGCQGCCCPQGVCDHHLSTKQDRQLCHVSDQEAEPAKSGLQADQKQHAEQTRHRAIIQRHTIT